MTDKILPENIDYSGAFPNLNRRLRLGIVGGGRISATQAAAARMSNYWEVVAGALSSDPVQAKARGKAFFIDEDRCYDSYKNMAITEAARPDGVDAVMITTPNYLHQDPAVIFMENGIDVLCDKPLTNEVSEAENLVAMTDKTGMVFGVSYVMSCFPMIRQARELVQSGALGAINQIHVEFMQDWMIPDDVSDAKHVKWRLDPKKTGPTSCTGDIGTHAAHLASFVSGCELTDLLAQMHVCGAPKPLEDTVFMMTRYDLKIPGTLMATRLASGNRGGLRLRVFGAKGGLEWDLERAENLKLNIYSQPDQILVRGHGHGLSKSTERFVRLGRGFSEGMIEAWANLYTEFAMAVAARKDDIKIPEDWLAFPRVEDGLHGVKFIEATVKSNAAGAEWVSL